MRFIGLTSDAYDTGCDKCFLDRLWLEVEITSAIPFMLSVSSDCLTLPSQFNDIARSVSRAQPDASQIQA